MFQRLTLKQMILNEIDQQPRGFVEKLAKVAGYSRGGNLKRVLLDEKKEFENFSGLVNLVKFCFKDSEHSIMENYSKGLDPNNKSARSMLEYLCCNRLLSSMKELIDRMLVCSNNESIEWATVYNLQLEWHLNYHDLDTDKHIQKIRSTKASVQELKTLLKLMESYCYYKKNNHRMAYEFILMVKDEIDLIDNGFIKNIYSTKVCETSSYINLWVLNNPEQAREDAEQVIANNIGNTHIAYANFTIGYSYFFTSYENSLRYLNRSIDIYNSIGRESAANDVQETVEKLKVFWEQDLTDYTFILKEAELWQKVKRNIDISVDLENDKENIYIPYYYYLKGICNNNSEFLMQSMIHFIKRGDSFQARIPMIELLRKGYSQDVLNDLLQINRA